MEQRTGKDDDEVMSEDIRMGDGKDIRCSEVTELD